MASNIDLIGSFVSFGDLDLEDEVEKPSPKISRQQSKISGVGGMGGGAYARGGKPANDLQMTEQQKQELMHSKTFLKVQADIKNKQKRSMQRAEDDKKDKKEKSEVKEREQDTYVDKDKAIAAIQGNLLQ